MSGAGPPSGKQDSTGPIRPREGVVPHDAKDEVYSQWAARHNNTVRNRLWKLTRDSLARSSFGWSTRT
ncbi:hypothetical protein ColTof3_04086 [Colletotrichum tofieldiae]|nr:hypothetical protein ColTof3_04086 [Colletotrichum tofieldiae]